MKSAAKVIGYYHMNDENVEIDSYSRKAKAKGNEHLYPSRMKVDKGASPESDRHGMEALEDSGKMPRLGLRAPPPKAQSENIPMILTSSQTVYTVSYHC